MNSTPDLKVSCSLSKECYIAGEVACGQCCVSAAAEGEVVKIDEITIQAHGFMKVDPRWIPLPAPISKLVKMKGEKSRPGDSHADEFSSRDGDENSLCFFVSDKKTLLTGELMTSSNFISAFSFSLPIPPDVFPSLRGTGAKYEFAFTISIKRKPVERSAGGSSVVTLPWKTMKNVLWSTIQSVPSNACQDIRVPFTVLGNGPNRRLQALNHQQLEQEQQQQQHLSQTETTALIAEPQRSEDSDTTATKSVVIPHWIASLEVTELDIHCLRGTLLDNWCQMDIPVLTNPVADWTLLKGAGTGGRGRRRQKPFAYVIRNGTEKVCTLYLQSNSIGPGESAEISIDFNGADCHCQQVCAGLEAEETNFIHATTTTTSNPRSNENGGSGDGPSSSSSLPNNVVRHRKVVDTFHSLTSSVFRTTFSLALPQDVPISMALPFIQINWFILLEFTVGPHQRPETTGNPSRDKTKIIPCTKLKWQIPMRVVPPEPCLDSTTSTSHSTSKLDSLKLWDFRIQEGIPCPNHGQLLRMAPKYNNIVLHFHERGKTRYLIVVIVEELLVAAARCVAPPPPMRTWLNSSESSSKHSVE